MIARIVLAAVLTMQPASVQRATEAWEDGRWAEAAEAYAEAYAETGDIAYLYARAQAQKQSGNCAAAIGTYEAFIATEPLPEAIEAAQANIAACREALPEPELESEPQTQSEPAVPPAAPPSDPPADDRPPLRPWQRDPTAAVLVAFGTAGAVTGIVLAAVARSEQAEAERASDVVAYGEHNGRAVRLSRASIPVLAVSGALLVGAAIRYAVLARRQRASTVRARLGPGVAVRF